MSQFEKLVKHLERIPGLCPLSMQIKRDFRAKTLAYEAMQAYNKFVAIASTNLRHYKPKRFCSDTHKKMKPVWKDPRDAGLYTIVDFLKGMLVGNGTMQTWCALLSAFDYKIDLDSALKANLSFSDKLRLEYVHNRTKEDADVKLHASLCVLCARVACSVCHKQAN